MRAAYQVDILAGCDSNLSMMQTNCTHERLRNALRILLNYWFTSELGELTDSGTARNLLGAPGHKLLMVQLELLEVQSGVWMITRSGRSVNTTRSAGRNE